MKALTKEQLKKRANHLCEVMLEKYGVKVKHGHALDIISRLDGHKDWNTASALAPKVVSDPPVVADKMVAPASKERPIAAKLQKAGALADFFASLDRETDVFVNEYQWSENNFGTVTSVCSLTYDQEIQNGTDVRLELNTEAELPDYKFGKSAQQTFDRTGVGRSQRRVKYLAMLNGFFNPWGKLDRSNL